MTRTGLSRCLSCESLCLYLHGFSCTRCEERDHEGWDVVRAGVDLAKPVPPYEASGEDPYYWQCSALRSAISWHEMRLADCREQ